MSSRGAEVSTYGKDLEGSRKPSQKKEASETSGHPFNSTQGSHKEQ
ncbi:hypothetical protein PROFUN_04332 [Planoprotostelium fungivorum]|uniref:Uncharacterized protein n=1 Tax=Planoprotostelium fungivorum TaxID=1890364 RepID=A0A2P6NVI1_9EUKA|nr:hypothetical protein PROFUN_04332 [Planoprotostelium fungivorum]